MGKREGERAQEICSVCACVCTSSPKYSEEACIFGGISGSEGVLSMDMIPNRHSDGGGAWDGIY